MKKTLLGISIIAFMVGGGIALAAPPSRVQHPSTFSVAITPLRTVEPLYAPLGVAQARPEPAATVPVFPVVKVAAKPPSNLTGRCPQFEAAFKRYGLKPVQTFSRIAYRESRCRPKAINIVYDKRGQVVWSLNKDGTFDSGILQINSSWKTVTRNVCGGTIDRLLTLDCNLRVAKYLLDHGGLAHWGVRMARIRH